MTSCRSCGSDIPDRKRPGGVSKLYCSESCGNWYRNHRVGTPTRCAGCGERFFATASRLKYCSPECRSATDKRKAAEAVDRYLGGESAAAIAQELGCSGTTVTKAVKRAGHELRPNPQTTCFVCYRADVEQIDLAILGGEWYSSVAKRFGLSRGSVNDHAKVHLGVKRGGTMKCDICDLPLDVLSQIEEEVRSAPTKKAGRNHLGHQQRIAMKYGVGRRSLEVHKARHLDNVEYQQKRMLAELSRLRATQAATP